MTHLLPETDGLPCFSEIHPEHMEPAIDTLLADNRARIEEILAAGEPWHWDNLVAPLEVLNERLSRTWAPVSHMNSVVNSEALRAAYNACLPKLCAYSTELGQNTGLYEAFRALRESDAFAALDAARRQTVEHALRDFRLAGVALPQAEKARFGEIAQRLTALSAQFEENLLDATNAWHRTVTEEAALAGIPASAQQVMRQSAEDEGEQGWRLSLDSPTFFAVMSYADERELRRELYEAWTTRASEVGPFAGRWDNGPVMEEILALRHEQAQLLGFASYAELSLEPKMARSVDEAMGFLDDLAQRSVPQARAEFEELQRFAAETGAVEDLQAWDTAYYGEKLRREHFDLSPEDLRPYFAVPRVLTGLFEIVSRLYDIRIEAREGVDTWHPEVGFYEIRAADGTLRGQFYTDLYACANKRGGAWMDVCRARLRTADAVQAPVAFLTCNFTPPVGNHPALLTHDEVITLFHEFGHGLHHMLTRVDVPSVAGISGVPWDAVELPSQLMENWCWEREALDLFAAHFETGEPLPEALHERMKAARNFQSATKMVGYLESALFDLRLHAEYDPAGGGRIFELLEAVRDAVAVVRPPELNRFPNGFAHIFAGDYAAGYYSYKWAEVLSADAYSRFEEEGIFNGETGRAFLENILEKGGTEDITELFVAFRGRSPSVEPMLRHSGLAR
ncbi:MAG: M3 family metallopeptidase [Nitrococcus sp.]|nr:M3 family metallopeptidase [Nitrococcus sp.]